MGSITAVTPNGPAAQAGLQAGDTIVAIDGAATSGLSQSDVIQQLRGPVGSRLAIRVARPGVALARDFGVQRALVVCPPWRCRGLADIAIFQVPSFNQNTTAELVEALAEARRQIGRAPRAASCSICAAIPAACSTRRSASPTCSSPGPDRLDRRAAPGEPSVFCRLGGQRRATDADRRADQWRLGLVIRNRRGGLAGCRARRRDRQLPPTAKAPCRPCCGCPTMAS